MVTISGLRGSSQREVADSDELNFDASSWLAALVSLLRDVADVELQRRALDPGNPKEIWSTDDMAAEWDGLRVASYIEFAPALLGLSDSQLAGLAAFSDHLYLTWECGVLDGVPDEQLPDHPLWRIVAAHAQQILSIL